MPGLQSIRSRWQRHPAEGNEAREATLRTLHSALAVQVVMALVQQGIDLLGPQHGGLHSTSASGPSGTHDVPQRLRDGLAVVERLELRELFPLRLDLARTEWAEVWDSCSTKRCGTGLWRTCHRVLPLAGSGFLG